MVKRAHDEMMKGLTKLAHELGYLESVPPVPYLRADEALCFRRGGTEFAHEVLCFFVNRRPRYELTVDFVGVRLPSIPRSLEELEGNAVATNVFDYQFLFLERPPSEILPKVIRLSAVEDVEGFVSRLGLEIRDVDRSIWERIR